jgi:molybdopterin-guanine dinucleotide biosynthesis protein A
VGVRANLKEPVSAECIENTLHALREIDRVSVQKSGPSRVWVPDAPSPEHVPDQYMFEAGPQQGLITQFENTRGRTTFLAGIDALAVTADDDQVERIQRFNARIAMQVTQACNARFVDDTRFLCFPDRAACRQAVQNQLSSK